MMMHEAELNLVISEYRLVANTARSEDVRRKALARIAELQAEQSGLGLAKALQRRAVAQMQEHYDEALREAAAT